MINGERRERSKTENDRIARGGRMYKWMNGEDDENEANKE